MIGIGCPKTPLRKSYFCEEHYSVDPKLSFKFNQSIFQCNLSQIQPKKGNFSTNNLTIYDSFINSKDVILFLVGFQDSNPFWVTENQLQKNLIEKFLMTENDLNLTCRTLKIHSFPCEKKSRTIGEFLAVFNCGIICGFREIFGAESLVQATSFILDLFSDLECDPLYLTYDDGCHLKKFIDHSELIVKKTNRIIELKKKIIVIDRFHYKGHKKENEYCRRICNPANYSELTGINTSVVEQINFWFSGFKFITKHMNQERFKFFIFLICDEFNEANLKFQMLKKMSSGFS